MKALERACGACHFSNMYNIVRKIVMRFLEIYNSIDYMLSMTVFV